MGRITFDPLEITIYPDADNNVARQKFTFAHELGHFLLDHSQYMTREYCQAEDIDLERPIELGIKDIMRLEWQANHFASCLLLPRNQFLRHFYSLAARFDLSDRGFGILYVDNQKVNLDTYYKITNALKVGFNVSRSVVRIRLKKLGLLNDARNV